jgi:hypothetical protein
LLSGVPGNGTVRQSAHAQSVLGMVTTPLRFPSCVSAVAEISVACVVSRVAAVRPSPEIASAVAFTGGVPDGAGMATQSRQPLANRCHVWLVTGAPPGIFATGTSMPSWVAVLTDEIGWSPCHPLQTIV